jgi:hypothetical protein
MLCLGALLSQHADPMQSRSGQLCTARQLILLLAVHGRVEMYVCPIVGDSEFDGTGIETSITGKFKITLHKKSKLPKIVQVGTAACLHAAAGR